LRSENRRSEAQCFAFSLVSSRSNATEADASATGNQLPE
jgi:hypothetical protein